MKRSTFEKYCLAFKVVLPGLVSIVLLTVTGEIQNIFSPSQQSESKTSHDKSKWLVEPVYKALKGLGETLLESYNNYFAFLLMMFLVHVMIHGLDTIRKVSNREKKQGFADEMKQILVSLLKSIVKYSLIFGFYQVLFVFLGLFSANASLMNAPNEAPRTPFGIQDTFFEEIIPSRILEEGQLAVTVDKFDYSRKPSLSIGKVLSQFDMNTISIKMSKNGKTAFVATNFPSALKIIDISDSEYPIILSSLALSKEFTQLNFKSLILLPDETKIYISSFENLEVVDISDLKSPLYLAKIEDKNIVKAYEFDSIYEPNLIISKDAQFLFVSGFGLQIFDISKPTAPILIKSVQSQMNFEKAIPSSIALSQDGKMLYYTDGSFWVYDVKSPRDLRVLSSFNTTATSIISSMILSKDFKTAFVLGLDSSSKEAKILIQKLDTEDIYAIKEGQIMKLNISSSSNPVFLNPAPNNFFLPIRFAKPHAGTWHNLLVFDTKNQQVVSHEKMLVKDDALSVLFTEDYKKMLVGSEEKLEIVEFYLDYPNKNAFTESNNLVQSSTLQMEFTATTFSSSNDESIFYSLSGSAWTKTFGIHRMSASFETFTNISMDETGKDIYEIVISRDSQRAYLVGQKYILIVNISNPENPTLLGQFDEEENRLSFSGSFVLSGDGKTGFMTYTYLGKSFFQILDFSDPKNPVKKCFIDIGKDDGASKPILSKDERTVFLISRILSVYDVSDHSSPVFITNLTFLVQDNYMPGFPQAILSPDGKTLIFKDASSMIQNFVHIIDVSNVSSPQTLSEFKFTPSLSSSGYASNIFAVSPDSKTLYILREFHFMVIDISTRSSPRYLGAIKIANPSADYITNFKLSEDMKKIYLFARNKKFYIISIQPKYSTFIKQDTLMLGERYSIDLEVLKMNPESLDYDRIDVDYRFTKLALVESRSLQKANFEDVVLKPAPSWMSLDLKSQTLTVEARRKNDIGAYRVYCAFSTKVQKDDFSTVNETSPENITATLLGLGYIDNQLFLTENFEGIEDFILPDNYPDWVKKKIYNILKKYSFGTFNELNVVRSLSVREIDGDKLKISTTSPLNLKVEINLKDNEAKFLSRYYGSLFPTITNGKSRLFMEGSLKDMNLALQEVVINLGNRSSCDGEIIIDDKLNPIWTESVSNISRLFNHNKPPRLNENFDLTIQNQVEKEVVWTGHYFQIKLNQKTFFDHFTEVENLNYQLLFVKEKNETSVLPSWLSFHDMTLMGTAPEEIFDRDFVFMLVVKNEFQEYKEPLKIHVKISSNFILKLLVKYSPYILSVVGLLISANKIFNIIFKSTYKHPKGFDVRVGEEITSKVIFPISFIREERREAETIMKFLQKKMKNQGRLLSHFMLHEERKLDKLKVLEKIKEILNELSYKEQEELDFYLEGYPARTGLVDQIVINTLTMDMLRSKEERETRTYYEKIKKQWHRFVDWDSVNSCFKINDEKFEKVLVSDGKETTISTGLLDKSNINFDLLKDALLAYSFDCQNLDILPVFAQFKVKEKIKANFLKRFIKTDLQDCPFSEKGKIGYGIQYQREFNTLWFSGIVRPDIQSKTLVFQITDVRQRILREIWIFGKGNGNRSLRGDIEKISYNKTESEAKGKGKEYQVL